jgi:ABC-type branched-subunit amino acid transport system ATPase component
MTDLLVARQLNKRFGGIHALRQVDVVQSAGETLGMIGPNGSGKSSFVNAVNGHLRLDSGDVRFAGETISGRPPHVAMRAGLTRTYQAVRVFARLTVRDNLLAAGLFHHRDEAGLLHDDAALEMLSWLQLDHCLDQISGGLTLFEQRRLELAMRIVLRPKLIMLDEPVGGLAPGEVRAMMKLLSELKQRCSIFIIEHTMQVIRELADRVIVLIAGEKVADAPPVEVLRDRRVIEQYLGAAHA